MKRVKIELKWAIIFTIMSLAWMLLEKTLGWHDESIADHWWLTLFFLPFAVIIYLLAMRETRRRVYKGKMTWKQGFLSGLLMAVFVTLLSPLAQYITHNYITPEYFESVRNYSVTNELMSIEKANAYFNITSYIWQAAIGAFAGGFITSAIGALFLMRK
ncbi:DUF4199 domain-containing protein [Jejudonia soesokkakensis]|uniref:DUF4199 domain-containing protein n=1 Tax=Jejudonia soesokkakensis TaxID=1323432 RepID=A0ABW2MTG7_9FLAO